MISLDRNLLGLKDAFGDATKRHVLYGEHVENLSIIVMNSGLAEKKIISDNVVAYPTNSSNRLMFFWDAYNLGKLIYNKEKFDLIVCQDPFLTGLAGLLLKRKTKSKLIVHCHGDFFGNFHWLKESWFNLLLLIIGKFVIRKVDAIRVVSAGIEKKFLKMGFDQKNIYRISTPVNLKQFSGFDEQKVKKIKDQYNGQKIILFVGRLVKAKNLDLLIETFADVLKQYKDAVLLLIGSGESQTELLEKIKAMNLQNNIFMQGAVNHDDLPNYYKACDFFVLPSTNESFGKVLLEAAAAKKPSVASRTLGAEEIIKEGGTGFIVDINNKEILAEKMLFLLKNDKIVLEMGEHAYKNAYEEYGWEKNTQKIINMWREVIKK